MRQESPSQTTDITFLDFLVGEGLIEEPEARRTEAASIEAGTSLEKTLMEFGLVNENDLYKALARFLSQEFLDADQIDISLLKNTSLPVEFLRRAEIIPARELKDSLLIAMSDPRDKDIINSIAFHLKTPISPAVTSPSVIKELLLATPSSQETDVEAVSSSDVERLTALANDGPVIKLVNDLIASAAEAGASDIHIESGEADAVVRFRIDGALRTHRKLPDSMRSAVTSRLKVISRLNISEKRRPQDGRAQISIRGRNIDIRLSTLPTQFGESVVLRLLDRSRVTLDWPALGYDDHRITQIQQTTGQPNGVFLVAGPTGSGKTTTLYTALGDLNTQDRKILTVEDPIEYSLPGINQVQVEPDINMDFSRALRSILRQDPDVIMVGEIRDAETAEIAVRAALVGRMVLSTIHTNDSLAAVVRLRDLGIPSYLLAATIRGILSQRLLRTICSACVGQGCKTCEKTGQHGRTVVSEFLGITPRLATAISKDADITELSLIAEEDQFIPMQQSAQRLADEGIVKSEEVIRAVGGSLATDTT